MFDVVFVCLCVLFSCLVCFDVISMVFNLLNVFLLRFRCFYRASDVRFNVMSAGLCVFGAIVPSVSLVCSMRFMCILTIQMRRVLINCFLLRAMSS